MTSTAIPAPSAASVAVAPFPPFRLVSDLLRENAQLRPHASALTDDDTALHWAALDALVDRVAASLQQGGLQAGDVVAVCAASSVRYAAVYLGALRAEVESNLLRLESVLNDLQRKWPFSHKPELKLP